MENNGEWPAPETGKDCHVLINEYVAQCEAVKRAKALLTNQQERLTKLSAFIRNHWPYKQRVLLGNRDVLVSSVTVEIDEREQVYDPYKAQLEDTVAQLEHNLHRVQSVAKFPAGLPTT